MKTIAIFAIALLFSLSAAFGQNVISGKVYAKEDGRPIYGAKITAKNDPSIFVKTDASGHFTMSLPPEVKVIEVTAPGFKKYTEGIGQKTVFVIEMTSAERGKSGKDEGSNADPTGSKDDPTNAASSGKGDGSKLVKVKPANVKATKTNDVAK